ncbi:hypothetical protein SIM91_04675 [Rhodococcus opacus]|uniref:hypothetical protein n=1 Tax=Rhodococcus opacus TaxID=37919 RepID=UPI0002A27E5D|nr:hypothetical protein [Rhodococcus opacus]ELB92768.1 putative membrane protein [Rhodococcus wratislaviensis IFP 2016]MDX5962617.1 hypothetical protein [Rhodococcus opacus]CAG7635805.1 hypothetical protein E143388_07719 [Rhodococcus opacus]
MSVELYFVGLSLIGIGGLSDLIRGSKRPAHHGVHKLSTSLALAGALCWIVGAVLSGQPLWWKIFASVFVLTIGFLLAIRSRFVPDRQWREPGNE